MAQQTVNGYVISVDIRKKKTLLVEGNSDRRILRRLAANCPGCKPENFVIDTAQTLKAPEELDEIGNRGKVLHTFEKLKQSEKFAVLVDREWDGLIADDGSWLKFKKPDDTERKYFTLGHSIENYGFQEPHFVQIVLSRCYDGLSQDSLSLVQKCFEKSLVMALAASKVIAEERLITRASSVFTYNDFAWTVEGDVALRIDGDIATRLLQRGVKDPSALLTKINTTYAKVPKASNSFPIPLYIHGHIGCEVIRCVIASKLADMGVTIPVVNQFAHEGAEAREASFREYLAGLSEIPSSLQRALDFISN
ncbi:MULTISPECIES: DUF4435 domain-containing protein [unclassified Yoonia]|uniref:DUF4435 domain-containing protein n=1 Tax=unclassified Yoonia TaxID=2629118 RepID=UPI002AFFA07B|nr:MULTISPECIES: DUF4435 domain-containing protein [unclassified Yoonia]